MKNIEREITPLTKEDFFIVLNNFNAKFDYSPHYHMDFELNCVFNSNGKRMVGDSIMEYTDMDLVLVGSNTPHAWTGDNEQDDVRVITLQFQKDFLAESTLDRKILVPIKEMLDKSYRGIEFSKSVQHKFKSRLLALCEKSGFDSFLEFLSILYDLSISRHQKLLSSPTYVNKYENIKSRRMNKVLDHIHSHYMMPLKLKEVAGMVNMSESTFSHFFTKKLHRSFSDYIHEVRIGNATKLLMESDKTIAEIGYECGFNNLSNFNRIFKKKKGCTPTDFKKEQLQISKYQV
jgi:AraC-like DNA-binding protein